MDRNTTLGLVLIAGIVLTWFVFFNKGDETQKAADPAKKTLQDSVRVADADSAQRVLLNDADNAGAFYGMSDSAYNALSDSAKLALEAEAANKVYGRFTPLRTGTDKVIRVETERYVVDLHTQGASIGDFFLKEYKTYDSLPLPIQLKNEQSRLSLNFQQSDRNVEIVEVQTHELYFQPMFADSVISLKGKEEKELVFRAGLAGGAYLDFVYTFNGDRFDYGLTFRQKGMASVIRSSDIQLKWTTIIPKTESSLLKMREKAAIYYRESGSVEWVHPSSGNGEAVDKMTGVDWVSFHSQFFAHTLLPEKEGTVLPGLKMLQGDPISPDPNDPYAGNLAKYMEASFGLDMAKENEDAQKLTFFAGPLDFSILKTYDRSMQQQIELGWGPLKWINRWMVIPLFNFMEGMNLNYGLIILLLAIFIKVVLYPLTYRTQVSTTKMRVVNNMPEMKALDEKYKDNPTKLQQEKMGIYRQMGVSLLGGCWPMLLSYPFLIAFFFFFPNSIELRQQSFLWAHDLSTYDSILDFGFSIPFYGDHVSLFTLLMTLSTYAITFISQQSQPQTASNPVLKWMPYFMPIIFLGLLNNYSAGLSWYYLVSNLIAIAQTLITKRFIDEDKLLADMRAAAKNKKEDGKGGKSRMERWAEQQQQRQREAQRQRAQQGKGGGKGR